MDTLSKVRVLGFVPLCLAALHIPVLASAQEQKVWLSLPAETEGCPDLYKPQEELATLLQELHSKSAKTFEVFLSVKRQGEGFEATLVLEHQGEHSFERALAAQTCSDVVEALVLSFQLHVDEGVHSTESEITQPPSSPPGHIPENRPVDSGPSSAAKGTKALVPCPPPAKELDAKKNESRARAPWVSLGLRGSFHALPSDQGGALGGALRSGLPLGLDWSLLAEVGFEYASNFGIGDGSVNFSATSFMVGGRYQWSVNKLLDFNVSLGPVLQLLHVPTSSTSAGSSRAPFAAGGLASDLGLAWSLGGNFFTEVLVGARGLLVSGHYVSLTGTEIWSQPRISLNSGLFLGWAEKLAGP